MSKRDLKPRKGLAGSVYSNKKELCFNGQHEHDIQHTVIEDLRKRDMAYQYYQHYFPEGGRNSGFCVNDSSLSKAAVVINGEKKSIVITKLDFSQFV